MRVAPGARLGPYEVLAAIGAGGMGEVYRARDTRLGREVAIKVLPDEFSRDASRLARFEREARSASALNHRNIITIHDFSSGEGSAWLVMEFVQGETLRAVVNRGPVPWKRLISIAAGIADGLSAAHAAGIVHRDLKPENIMIAADGVPKILDFGLVKSAPAAAAAASHSPTEFHVTHAGTIMGTAQYMSPEQARGEDVDFRTDHFSFGLVLYEMATGRHPFARATPVETLAAILGDDLPPLGEAFPQEFVSIVERCLARDKTQRYGATSDLAHDLARLEQRRQLQFSTVPRQRSRRIWWAAALIAVPLIVLATLFLWPETKSLPGEPQYFDIATPFLRSVLLDEIGEPVSISPNGRHLLISGVGTNGVEGIWIRDLHSGSSRLLAEKGKLPAWSADSKAVAYFAEGKLKTVAIDGGPSRIICDARAEGLPAWHGDVIVFGQYSIKDAGFYRVAAEGGTPEMMSAARLADGRFSTLWWPQFLPGGDQLLLLRFDLVERSGVGHSVIVSAADGSSAKLIARVSSRPVFANGHLLFVRDGTLLAQPFDLEDLQLKGEPRPLLAGLHYFRSTGTAAFSVSQNGMLAWRSARGPSRLVWMDRAGMEYAALASAEMLPDGRLSPDMTRYAVGVLEAKQGVADVWLYDVTRTTPERITFSALDEKAPVWFPDSKTLLYRSDGGGGPPDIVRLRPGDDTAQLLHSGLGVDEPHDISADGKWLLFVDYFSTGTDINLKPLDPDGPAQPYVATPFNETSPRFSPDGSRVAYQSDISGTAEVYVRSFKDTASTARVSASGGTRPRWRRDGSELFFLGPNGRLMAAPVVNGVPGVPRMLFQAVDIVDFDPAPDGSRFLVQLAETSGDTEVHILTNWPSLLRTAD